MLQRYLNVLRRHPEFLKLWSGQSISSLGSAITTLALPLTALVITHISVDRAGEAPSAVVSWKC